MSQGPPEWDDPVFAVSFDDQPARPPRPRPRAPRVLAAAVGALLLLGAATVATSLVLQEPAKPRASAAQGVQKPSAALQRANEFATEFNTYSATHAAEYQQRVSPLLTAAYASTFRSGLPAMFASLRVQRTGSIATVASSAIERAGNRSATALVFVNVATTSKNSWGPVGRTLRWNVHLTRLGDQWRVSGYDVVAARSAQGAAARRRPADTPEAAAAAATETIFSFQYDDLARHLGRSRGLLTPSYADRFDTVSSALTGTAPSGSVVEADTVTTALKSRDKARAAVLVAFDQSRRATTRGRPSVLRMRLRVDLVRTEGRWLVDRLELL